MKFKCSAAYEPQQNAILKLIENYDATGDLMYGGSRNSIKSFLLLSEDIVIKRFKTPNIFNRFVYRFFRPSKAERSFTYAQYLLDHEIGTPRPIAFAENQTLLTLKDSYYACEHFKNDFTYRELVLNQEHIENWERVLKEFTAYTFKMHEANVLFLDHSPGNTLIQKTPKGYRFALVDLNRMRFKSLDLDARIKNFAKLTHRKDMVKIMSEEYARLYGADAKEVFEKMWQYTTAFQERFHRKRRIKKKLLFWR